VLGVLLRVGEQPRLVLAVLGLVGAARPRAGDRPHLRLPACSFTSASGEEPTTVSPPSSQ
jgi:hypothetical protein